MQHSKVGREIRFDNIQLINWKFVFEIFKLQFVVSSFTDSARKYVLFSV